MSQHKLLCRNREWPQQGLCCRDRVGQAKSFYRDRMFLRHDREWPNGEVLCCDRSILCRDIVGQAEKIFYCN